MGYTEKQKLIPTNVNYTSKDFSSIKADLIEYTKSYFPDTYKDFNETSPGMMLIELSSYVGDVLSYYIDYNYKENILSTATEKRNVRRLAEFLGYKTPNKTPSVVRLKVTTTIDADTDGNPKYGDLSSGHPIDSGLQITSNIDSEVIFETTGEVDFTASGSGDPEISAPTLDDNGEADTYTLTRYVRAVSGKTKTKSFTITSPTKFLELDLGEDDLIEVLSCEDSSGQKWYEVDYLAQEKVLRELHYSDSTTLRTSAYDMLDLDGDGSNDISPIPIPYTAEYIRTNKKFITKYDEDSNSYKFCFGNGLFRFSNSGSNVDPVEQAGVTINGTNLADIPGAIGSTTGNNLNLGETPTNTVLTFTYRAGGGLETNVQTNEITEVQNSPAGVTITVTNDEPSIGGTDGQTVDEIKTNASAFFASQLRCVTKEDYTARILSIPQKFGSIAKCYVERLDPEQSGGTLLVSTLSYNQNKQLVQTPQLALQNVARYLNQFRMINDIVDFGFTANSNLFSGYIINFGVRFLVNYDRRFNPTEVKINVIDAIKDFFKIEKMQFRQSVNMNDLQYNILALDGVVGIRELKLFQDGNSDYAAGRQLYYYKGDGEVIGTDSNYGFQYNFDDALQDGIYRPSVSPSVFELKNPNQDIYGKVI
tara:strand:+ start:1941 stop:3884 length:1944 start_codon:yes stop_codon:yes gene_type:complete